MDSIIFGFAGIAFSIIALHYGKELNKRGNALTIALLVMAWAFYICAAGFSDNLINVILYSLAGAFTSASVVTRAFNHSNLPESPKVLEDRRIALEAEREKQEHDKIVAELMKDLPKH